MLLYYYIKTAIFIYTAKLTYLRKQFNKRPYSSIISNLSYELKAPDQFGNLEWWI